MSVTAWVPATTANLGPGYDCLGLAINLKNKVVIEEREAGLEILVTGEGEECLPLDRTNMVYRSAERVFQLVGKHPAGLFITTENHIPLSRGLGSSAAAIVGGMVAANGLLGFPLDEEALIFQAAQMEGHPDNVVPAILGGFAVSVTANDGSLTHFHKKTADNSLRLIIAVPDFPLSTKESRSVLPSEVSLKDACFNTSRVGLLVGAFATGNFRLLSHALQDRIHQPYRKRLVPGFDQVVQAAKDAGALGAVLSGAGPSIVAFALQNEDAIGQAMNGAFLCAGVQCQIMITTVSNYGASVHI